MPIIQLVSGENIAISFTEERNLWIKSLEPNADWHNLSTGKCVQFKNIIKILDSGVDKWPDFLRGNWTEESSEERSARRKKLMLEGIKRTNNSLQIKLCNGELNSVRLAI